MQIKGIHIKNFLSFEAFSWEHIDPHLSVIVGPNGVGKTNLFHALRAGCDILALRQRREAPDWSQLTHSNLTTPVIEISLDVEFTSEWEQSLLCAFVAASICNEQFLRDNRAGQLNPDEMLRFSDFLLEGIRPEQIAWFFSGRLIMTYDGRQWIGRYEGVKAIFHLHLMGPNTTSLLAGMAWSEFAQTLLAKRQENDIYLPHLLNALQKLVENPGGFVLRVDRPNTVALPTHRAFEQLVGITLEHNRFYDAVFVLRTLLEHALVFTDNIRRQPLYTFSESDLNAPVLDLSNGEQLALYLFKKKNGVQRDRAQYDAIQRVFTYLTSRHFDVGLTTVPQQGIELDIHLLNQWGDIPLEFSGAGIAEALFLSSLIASGDGRVVLLDEPASNIHVTMQKAFMDEIRARSKSENQFLIATHSPTLVDPGILTSISYFSVPDGSTYRAPDGPLQLSTQARKRLEQELYKTAESRALLFSRYVLLVEGDTELAVLPMWFEKTFNQSFAGRDIAVYNVGGDQNFKPLLQFLHWLHIPRAIVCDGKVISYHLTACPPQSHNKSIVEQLDEAGIPRANAFTRTNFAQLCQELEAYGVFTLAKNPGDEIEALPIVRQHTAEASKLYPTSKVRQGQYIAETYPCPAEGAALLQKVVQYFSKMAS